MIPCQLKSFRTVREGYPMITYDMTNRSGVSKYEHLHHCIRSDIRSGLLEGGSKLPSKRELSKHLGVSVSTIEQAYDLLVSEGYIEAKPGSGFYVCPNRNEGTYVEAQPQHADTSEKLDTRWDRSPQSLFPAETWARLMRKTLSERKPELLEAVPFNGLFALRRAITSYLYEFRGIYASPDQVVIGAGTEYLYGRLLQLFGSRCTIAIGDYGSKNLFNVSSTFGNSWDYLHVDQNGLCVDALEDSPANLVHVSPANHFPTGAVLSQDRRDKLIRWIHEKPQRYIIEDDYDSELRFSGRSMPALFSQDNEGKVIYLNTFSKTLVPSIRISYMVLPRPLMELYRKQSSFYSCTVSSFEQLTLAQFISGGYFERHIMKLRRHYDRQRSAITSAIKESKIMSIAHMMRSDVGTHMLLHVDTHMGDDEIVRAAAQRGIKLVMLSDYSVRPTMYSMNCIVVNEASIGLDQIETMIHVLEDIFARDINRAKQSHA